MWALLVILYNMFFCCEYLFMYIYIYIRVGTLPSKDHQKSRFSPKDPKDYL